MDRGVAVGRLQDALVAVVPANAITLVARLAEHLEELTHAPLTADVMPADDDHVAGRRPARPASVAFIYSIRIPPSLPHHPPDRIRPLAEPHSEIPYQAVRGFEPRTSVLAGDAGVLRRVSG